MSTTILRIDSVSKREFKGIGAFTVLKGKVNLHCLLILPFVHLDLFYPTDNLMNAVTTAIEIPDKRFKPTFKVKTDFTRDRCFSLVHKAHCDITPHDVSHFAEALQKCVVTEFSDFAGDGIVWHKSD